MKRLPNPTIPHQRKETLTGQPSPPESLTLRIWRRLRSRRKRA